MFPLDGSVMSICADAERSSPDAFVVPAVIGVSAGCLDERIDHEPLKPPIERQSDVLSFTISRFLVSE